MVNYGFTALGQIGLPRGQRDGISLLNRSIYKERRSSRFEDLIKSRELGFMAP